MRAAFFVDEFPAISETFVLDQICGLMDRGDSVDVFARRLHARAVVHDDVRRYGLMARATQLDPPDAGSKLERAARGALDVARASLRHPLLVGRSLDPRRYGSGVLKLKEFYRLRPFMDGAPYDVVHCHFGPNGDVAVALRAMGAFDARVITQFHGYDASVYVQEHGPSVYRQLFEQGDLFLCVSERLQSRLVELGCPPGKTRVHHTGVKVSAIPFRTRERSTSRAPRLLSVCRLVEKKGIEYALRAVSLVAGRHPGMTYAIVGEGAELPRLRALAAELALGETVQFLGARSRDEVANLMATSDALLAPSVSARNGDEEGIPVVLMEALACGLPVISTRHAGIPELIADGVSGLLAPERDAPALARHLELMLAHPERCDEMARAGRQVVERAYDVDTLNDRLHDLYSDLIR